MQALYEACKKDGKWDKFKFVSTAHDLKRDIEELCGAANPYYEVLAGFKDAKGKPLTGFGPDDITGMKPPSCLAIIKALHLKKKVIEAATFADQGNADVPDGDGAEAPQTQSAAVDAAAWAEEANNV